MSAGFSSVLWCQPVSCSQLGEQLAVVYEVKDHINLTASIAAEHIQHFSVGRLVRPYSFEVRFDITNYGSNVLHALV